MTTLMLDVKLTYREEKGWCVTGIGPTNTLGYEIPIRDYLQRLHVFHQLTGPLYGPEPPRKRGPYKRRAKHK